MHSHAEYKNDSKKEKKCLQDLEERDYHRY